MIFVSFLLHLVVRLGLVRRERHPQLLDAQSEEGEGLVDANNPSIVLFFFLAAIATSISHSVTKLANPARTDNYSWYSWHSFSRSCYCTSPISASLTHSYQTFLFFSSVILFFAFNPRQLNRDDNEDLSDFGVRSRGSMYSGKFCFRYKFNCLFLHLFIYQVIFKRFCYLRLIRDTISSHIWISCQFKRTFTPVLFYAVVILKKDYTY